jgi:ubiquitin carboxyl-terminal hydrolase 4/11/15
MHRGVLLFAAFLLILLSVSSVSQLSTLFPAAEDAAATEGGSGNGKGALTLAQCLTEHTRDELLEAGNEVYCSRCKEHRQARKVVRFCRSRLPSVLVLSLKRFEYRDVSGLGLGVGGLGMGRQGAHREKIDVFVDFPVDGLDLAPFCQPEPEPGEGSTLYDLFAVCNHYGRMGFGHYTAAARDWTENGLSPEWFSYDDNDVSGPLSPEEIEAEVHSRNAYILFYRRRGAPVTAE